MISSSLKPGTNAYSVCGRPTLIVYERFMKDSLRNLTRDLIYRRKFLSELIKNLENHTISNAGRKQRAEGRSYTRNIYNAQLLVLCQSCRTINKRQLRFHHVKILTFAAEYARKEAQTHADMRLAVVVVVVVIIIIIIILLLLLMKS